MPGRLDHRRARWQPRDIMIAQFLSERGSPDRVRVFRRAWMGKSFRAMSQDHRCKI